MRLGALLSASLDAPLRWLGGKLDAYRERADNFNDCDPRSNGELFLIERAAPHWRAAVDVGANVGDWTDAVLAANPACRVDCFEASPRTFERLRGRLGARPNAALHALGLGAGDGAIELFDYGAGSGLTSFVSREGTIGLVAERRVSVPVMALDRFLAERGDPRVDFVKIDTEGFEMAVLRGMTRALEARRVGAVQFEYGGTWIDAGETLCRANALFAAHGYHLYRLMPRGLRRAPYRLELERFQYANYLAAADEALLGRWGLPIA